MIVMSVEQRTPTIVSLLDISRPLIAFVRESDVDSPSRKSHGSKPQKDG